MVKVSDDGWEWIKHHFPEEGLPEGRAARKPVPARKILDAVLWVLNTGAQWLMLLQSYPNYKTVHRRFQQWCKQDVLRELLMGIAKVLCDFFQRVFSIVMICQMCFSCREKGLMSRFCSTRR